MKILSEKNSIRLLASGVILFFSGIFLFLWEESISFSSAVDSEKFSQFGDFIGGIIGSIWSLAGVILFYVALTEQKKDIQINRKTLETQVEALQQQIKEFKLQRIELEETRKVFTEQSITLKNQRFENTFFQLLSLHHEIIDKLNFIKKSGGFRENRHLEKREVLSQAFIDLNHRIEYINSTNKQDEYGQIISTPNEAQTLEVAESRLMEAYDTFYFNEYKQLLSHYFRNIYHVYKFIFTNRLIEKKEKQFYASIVRAQLSSDELFLILYNSLKKGLGYPNFLFLIKEFDVMQNFDFGLIEKYKFHKEIYTRWIASVTPEFDYEEQKTT
ncbi:putative phage abortive infection protein [Sunxiuqinia elliptica]|uniref:Putative phage abortive infection protein n=1 Tax=Sunxiuqinia elliptica TaxID=655355 RepID=A0A1I2HQ68_9BACT|nr:putative phage abortive infection protein [Sunxiuqinia elliptica]SFF31989.1 Putative phage abortive infection protein [Sunxiuqinia elliptica]